MKCCDLSAGQLRHTVSLQEEQDTADGGGGSALTWVDVDKAVRGKLQPVSGNERVFSQRLEANVTHKLWIRFRTGVTTDKRIVYKTRPMQIRHVLNLEERDRWLELQLEEGVVT